MVDNTEILGSEQYHLETFRRGIYNTENSDIDRTKI
jgi:hypothetical protein